MFCLSDRGNYDSTDCHTWKHSSASRFIRMLSPPHYDLHYRWISGLLINKLLTILRILPLASCSQVDLLFPTCSCPPSVLHTFCLTTAFSTSLHLLASPMHPFTTPTHLLHLYRAFYISLDAPRVCSFLHFFAFSPPQ